MKQHVFLCKHCQNELPLPRAGMRLQEVKSWFRYLRCPRCRQELRVVERVPEPVVPAATQQPLWTGESTSTYDRKRYRSAAPCSHITRTAHQRNKSRASI